MPSAKQRSKCYMVECYILYSIKCYIKILLYGRVLYNVPEVLLIAGSKSQSTI